MKQELFAELMQSAGEALDHARGKRELRMTTFARSARVKASRARMKTARQKRPRAKRA